MTAPDLRNLLDAPLTGSVPVDGALPSPSDAAPASSDTALQVDRWGRRRGDELAEEWKQDPDFPQADQHVAADALAALFENKPRLAERPVDPHRAAWWRELLETPEYRALHAQTVLSPSLSRLGAAELARQWLTYVAEEPPPPPPNPTPNPEADGEVRPDELEDPARTVARIRSTRAAAKAASETVEAARDVERGLGSGGPGGELDPATLARCMQAVRDNPTLRRILAMAGRYRARAQTLQRERVDAHRAEITGIELAGDVARLLPTELLAVAGAVPELELLALYRLATRRCLAYRHHRREPVGLGPIVVSVDESGSMVGEPVERAKGLALAMAWIARAQGRPFLLAGFSAADRIHVAHNSPDEIITWGTKFLGGGSDCDLPLASVRPYWPTGPVGARADHIIIGDAIVEPDQKFLDDYRAWAKQNNVRTFSLVIGRHESSAYGVVSDGGCWCIPDLSLDNPAIETVLSIGG